METLNPSTRWKVEDLDFSRIAIDRIRNDETLFYLASSASFIESGSDLYTQNLIDFFHGDDEVVQWLVRQWEPEELQHGRALRAYVAQVWPEFDWEPAFAGFLDEYQRYCKVGLLAPSRGLEMSARCVVETGTATYYRALARATTEPIFAELANRIATDEVKHYKNFLRFFRRYREHERLGRIRILRTLSTRTWELRSEDADCAIRHIARARDPARADDPAFIRDMSSRMSRTVSRNLSPSTTLKMLMRPLELPKGVQAALLFPVEQFMQRFFLR
jgi:hypothetical protein